MMYWLFSYMMLASLGLAFFWLLERLLLDNNTHFLFRRCYYYIAFLSSAVFPFLGHFFQLSRSFQVPTDNIGRVVLQTIQIQMDGVGSDSLLDSSPSLFLPIMISSVWLIGLGVLLLRLFIRAYSLHRLLHGVRRMEINGVTIFLSREIKVPFNFFGRIYVPKALIGHPSFRSVLIHEQEHTRGRHYIDLVLAELVCLLFWFNPFAWLLKRGIQRNLEFLADRAVLESGTNRREYQYELLETTLGVTAGPLCSFYNINDLKKRIKMMNKSKSKSWVGAGYFLALPIAALLLLGGGMMRAEAPNTGRSMTNFISVDFLPLDMESPLSDGDTTVYDKVDVMPEFPGGSSKMYQFICKHLKYPKEAAEKGLSGKVYISFIVEKDGSLTDIRTIKRADPLFEKEAIRTARLMPKWTPGEQNGQKVRVRIVTPVLFRTN